MIDLQLEKLMLDTSKARGATQACGTNVRHKSKLTADKAAEKRNASMPFAEPVEAVPCYWCKDWHVSPKLTVPEMKALVNKAK